MGTFFLASASIMLSVLAQLALKTGMSAAFGWMLGEDVTALRLLGIALICSGIAGVGWSCPVWTWRA